MQHFTAEYKGLELRFRDLEEPDIPVIVSYWCESSLEYLRSIGVDTSKVGDKQAVQHRFRQAIPAEGRTRSTIVLVVEAPGRGLVGYTSLNSSDRDGGYAHVHILDEKLRGAGMAPFFFHRVIRFFLQQCSVDRIVFQASPENTNVNRLLQKSGLVPRRTYLQHPDGMARPGFFNVYELTRSVVEIPRPPEPDAHSR